jgi:hypothetical protein
VPTIKANEYTRYAESSLEKFRCFGGGPRFSKRGRNLLYRLSDIDAWLSETMVDSTSELKLPSWRAMRG